ncbi:ribonuclease P protein component [Azohydromonas sp.]|uniref:ribonuclease P protein component n=1 Tax=Azohydromonas sp. TaxID=1872666 RepID=UPI002B699556|nr:ribonuclease P protein component [Azohydromonas sp.]HMM84870.1 ribonuclease P protein component [Azohydromonas sp.]
MLARLVHSADFQRVLATAPRARSAHFAAHHLPAWPMGGRDAATEPTATKLSTGLSEQFDASVDNRRPSDHWVGFVIPKRLARRSVTRQLIKRQMREALRRHLTRLPGGLWVLRLRAGFDRAQFRSAGSGALRGAARVELDALLAAAARRQG